MRIKITLLVLCLVLSGMLQAQEFETRQGEIGWRLYQEVAQDEASQSSNIALSPASISRVLASVYLGAEGATAVEMRQVLGWENVSHAALIAHFGEAPSSAYRAQNFLAIDREIKVRDAYRKQYTALKGELLSVDFKYEPAAAIRAVNARVKEATQGKVTELLPTNAADDRTKMIAINTLTLDAKWATPFAVASTTLSEFTAHDGHTFTVPMMRKDVELKYAETADLQLVELPYATPGLKMVLLLPSRSQDYNDWEAGLAWSRIAALQEVAQPAAVDLYLPKFEQGASIDLTNYMRNLGLSLSFSEAANFTGISQYNTFLSAMQQQVQIAVTEQGTQAAAATAAVMSSKGLSMGRKLFLANRPFLYFIQDEATGELLFAGRYLQPSQKNVALAAQADPSDSAPFLHVVSHGETLYQIAKLYQLTVDDLLAVNDLNEPVIHAGQKLTIATRYNSKGAKPVKRGADVVHPYQNDDWTPRSVAAPNTAAKSGQHVVQSGETLYSIAHRYGLKVNELQALNCLRDAQLNAGAVLLVAPKAYDATQEYIVKSGDSLSKIVKAFQLDQFHPQALTLIRVLNDLDSDLIYINQKLKLPLAFDCGAK